MGFLDFFRKPLRTFRESKWKELGSYNATFTGFGTDMYKNDIVRGCVRALSEHTSKANAVSSDESIARILNLYPNMYMTGKDFLAKTRTMLELKNTAFIYIQRDDKNNVTGFYPVPYSYFECIESAGRLFIEFLFDGDAARSITLPWADLAVLRKDFNKSDIAGDSNIAILQKLELINTTEQGIANAVKSTANLRGILKSTKAMLKESDIKEMKSRFVSDYMNISNEGGIAALDGTMDFTPIKMEPAMTSAETLKEFREDIYRYFGVNDKILTSSFSEEEMEAFYDARIEPFLVALSMELTKKIFTRREIGFKAFIMYESNRINFASTKTKLAFVDLVDRGALTPNEWRAMFNMAPVEGGDVPIRRLDTVPVNKGSDDDGTSKDI